jgi:predicted N-acetyltransferase YhbS
MSLQIQNTEPACFPGWAPPLPPRRMNSLEPATTVQRRLVVRQATADDAPACAQILYRAFSTINAAHNFPCDFPDAEAPVGMLAFMFSQPSFYALVAEADGRIVGSNVLDERAVIAGVGPITVDPEAQNLGVGRTLMQAVIDRANQRGAPGIRLVQAAFHNRSLSLYTTLGFDVREPLTCLQGRTRERNLPGCAVRPAQFADLEACNALARGIHGFERSSELEHGMKQKTALVVERDGRVSGYASTLAFFGHATAETNLDLEALIASVESFGGPGILVPVRNSSLFRWCLSNGLRLVQPMTLMSMGLYNEPAGAWLPSVTF